MVSISTLSTLRRTRLDFVVVILIQVSSHDLCGESGLVRQPKLKPSPHAINFRLTEKLFIRASPTWAPEQIFFRTFHHTFRAANNQISNVTILHVQESLNSKTI